jgi:UDP:flavonoid glycosyltransferase YjiC (YdhE family)
MDLPLYTASFTPTTALRYTSLFPFQSVCPEESMDLAFLVTNGVVPLSKLTPAQAKASGRCFITHYKELLPAIMHHFLQHRPDLVVADSMTYGAIDAALNLSIPLIINNPSIFPTTSFNLPSGWSGQRANTLKAEGILAFLRRWLNHTQRRCLFAINAENIITASHLKLRSAFIGTEFANLALPSSVPNLVNTFFGFEYAQPVPPHYFLIGPTLSREAEALAVGDEKSINIGEILGTASPEKCPEMLWLDELVRENLQVDVIVINFGTTGFLKPRQFQAMLEGFDQLHASSTKPAPYVLWRISEKNYQYLFNTGNISSSSIPSYVHITSWFCSQAAVLRHPAVHLFISHGGINSVHEALLSGIPIIAISLFADQPAIAARIMDSGVGLSLPADHFTAHTFAHTVSQILGPQATFSHTVQELRKMVLSDPKGLGRTHGADIIEDVLRRGHKHIVPLAEPGWARAGLDVLVVDVVVIVGLIWAAKVIVQKVWWVVRRVVGAWKWTRHGHGSLKQD